MGIEKDYLMRQLHMLFEVIRKIIQYRKKGEKDLALKQIEYFYECLKVNPDITSGDTGDLLKFLETARNFNNEQLEMVACVLMEQGYLSEDRARRLDYFSKAFVILENVENTSAMYSIERQIRLSELKNILYDLKN